MERIKLSPWLPKQPGGFTVQRQGPEGWHNEQLDWSAQLSPWPAEVAIFHTVYTFFTGVETLM